MTLIVAHRISYGVRLVSDMRVSFPDDSVKRSGYLTGVLKTVVVHPKACIAFAGEPVSAALEAIRSITLNPATSVDLDYVRHTLLDAHLRTDRGVDFLLATLEPTDLSRVAGGTIDTGLPTAWIGSHEAFTLFQRAFVERSLTSRVEEPMAAGDRERYIAIRNAGRDEMNAHWREHMREHMEEHELDDLDIGGRAVDAMQIVVDSDLSDVGEHAIFVVPRPPQGSERNFAYLESSAVGDLSYAVLGPREPGIGAIGIYFPEGALGLLYHPIRSEEPLRYANVSASEFADAVEAEHGFRLTGIGIGAVSRGFRNKD